MAGLPEVKEDVAMVDSNAVTAEKGDSVATPVVEGTGGKAGGQGAGGKKGKKKGKK